jgi:hypothetical protein
VRPAALQKVANHELAEFVNLCISPRESRPRARQLLKHPYFDSIRKDKLLSSRSDAALAAAGGGADSASDYGSLAASAAVSRTASSLADLVAASASGGHLPPAASAAPVLQGAPSAGSVVAPGPHPLSRTVSADAHSERAHSDAGSVRSQRSNASELAAVAALENIAEEEEGGSSGAASPTGAPRSHQASRRGSPRGDASPPKPGSPSGSEGCRCDATERRFTVRGDWLEVGKRVQLRLRICEPTGEPACPALLLRVPARCAALPCAPRGLALPPADPALQPVSHPSSRPAPPPPPLPPNRLRAHRGV